MLHKTHLICFYLLGFIFLLSSCQFAKSHKINVPETPHTHLSSYGFFTDHLASLSPAEDVIPYDLNTPLFSDYSLKERFIWIPPETKIVYTDKGVFDFPKNSVLIKNFFYNYDEKDLTLGRNIIETRLLINRGEEWEAVGYIWNEEQSDAILEVVGGIEDVTWIDSSGIKRDVQYIIPNKNQCKTCHQKDNKQIPIGPNAKNLNKDYHYSTGSSNQLEMWTTMGKLSGLPSLNEVQKLARWDDPAAPLHHRAMAYLDINCGHCHNEGGSANTSGLHLQSESSLGIALGIYKATVSAGAGTGGHTYSIVPGSAAESIMVYRMNSLNPGAMMPELGRTTIHEEGVQLISDWINQLNPDPKFYGQSLE